MSRALATGVILLTAGAVPAFAWTDTGHMLVAQIAVAGLKKDGKEDVLKRFTGMTDALYSPQIKALRTKSKNPDFARYKVDDLVGVAVWEDSLGLAFDYQKAWHFSDTPVVLDNGCKMNHSAAVDAASAINEEEYVKAALPGGRDPHAFLNHPPPKKDFPQDVVFGM